MCDGSDEVQAQLLGMLNGEHFSCPETSELYRRITGLLANSKPIPRIRTLKNDPTLSPEAQESLAVDCDICMGTGEAEALINQLEQFRKLRIIYDGTVEITKSIKETSPDSIEAALRSMERTLLKARSSYEESKVLVSGQNSNAEELVDRVLKQTKPDRIATGFSKFDEATGGFARKDLVLVAASTGAGKSVMAEQLAINMYFKTGQNRSVALVSFEMDEEEIYARLLSNLTGISFDKVYLRRLSYGFEAKAKEKWQEFNRHGENNGCRFSVWCPTFDVTPSAVGAFLRSGRYDAIFIDYVGLVAPERKAELWENLGEITKGFKAVARQNDCAVIVMAQLDEETNKVKYSKAMRHHSSYVWQWVWGEEQDEVGQVVVEQTKARHCKAFPFVLKANFSTMSFYDSPEEYQGGKDVTAKEENQTKRKRSRPPQPLYAQDEKNEETEKPVHRIEKPVEHVVIRDPEENSQAIPPTQLYEELRNLRMKHRIAEAQDKKFTEDDV